MRIGESKSCSPACDEIPANPGESTSIACPVRNESYHPDKQALDGGGRGVTARSPLYGAVQGRERSFGHLGSWPPQEDLRSASSHARGNVQKGEIAGGMHINVERPLHILIEVCQLSRVGLQVQESNALDSLKNFFISGLGFLILSVLLRSACRVSKSYDGFPASLPPPIRHSVTFRRSNAPNSGSRA